MRPSMTSFYEEAVNRGRKPAALDAAVGFFNFKVFAARWAIQHINDMPPAHYVIEQEPTPSGLNRVRTRPEPGNDASEAQANIYLDLFLVEIAAVKEALAQVANAAFTLGQRLEDVTVSSAHSGLQTLTGNDHTGIRDWVVLLSSPGNWLWRLNDYRNQVSHRRFVTLSQVLLSVQVGGDSQTQGRIPAECRISVPGGADIPLLRFLDESESRTLALADATLARFTDLL
jgi:hypothetical protein